MDEFTAIRKSQIELHECMQAVLRKQNEFSTRLVGLTQAMNMRGAIHTTL